MHIVRGMTAGFIAGLAASWMMNQLSSEGQSGDEGAGREDRGGQEHQQEQSGDDATVKTAEAISQRVLHHPLTQQEKQIAGPLVHYAYGSLMGALYGGVCEIVPAASMGFGLPFAAALWLLGDEIAVPALGLGPTPDQVPVEKHVDALAAHFCYGMTTDCLRRILRHVV